MQASRLHPLSSIEQGQSAHNDDRYVISSHEMERFRQTHRGSGWLELHRELHYLCKGHYKSICISEGVLQLSMMQWQDNIAYAVCS